MITMKMTLSAEEGVELEEAVEVVVEGGHVPLPLTIKS